MALSVSIPGCQVGDSFVTFTVVVSKNDASWTVRRRYQDFVKLHTAVRKSIGAAAAKDGIDLPELPPKVMRLGMSKFAPDFVEERRAKLEAYMQRLVAVVDPERVEPLDDFLVYAEHWLKEAIELLADVKELQQVVKMLRQAADAAAAVHQKRAGGPGAAAGRRRGAGDSDEDEEDGEADAKGHAAVDGPELLNILKEVVRMLREYYVMLRSQTEDAEERSDATAASNAALTSRLRSKEEDISDARQMMEALRQARQRECEKERAQLQLVSQQARTVAAELRRVVTESTFLRQASSEHTAALAGLRAALLEWEKGLLLAAPVQPPAESSPVLSPLQQVATICARAHAFNKEVEGHTHRLASTVSIPTSLPSRSGAGQVQSMEDMAVATAAEAAAGMTKGIVANGPALLSALLMQSVAADTADMVSCMQKLASGQVASRPKPSVSVLQSSTTAGKSNTATPMTTGSSASTAAASSPTSFNTGSDPAKQASNRTMGLDNDRERFTAASPALVAAAARAPGLNPAFASAMGMAPAATAPSSSVKPSSTATQATAQRRGDARGDYDRDGGAFDDSRGFSSSAVKQQSQQSAASSTPATAAARTKAAPHPPPPFDAAPADAQPQEELSAARLAVRAALAKQSSTAASALATAAAGPGNPFGGAGPGAAGGAGASAVAAGGPGNPFGGAPAASKAAPASKKQQQPAGNPFAF